MNIGLSLGSNRGNRLRNLQLARDYLVSLTPHPPYRQSAVYETVPIACAPGASPYLNAVVEIEFSGGVRALFDKTHAYELGHGRAAERAAGINAARTIDIDILYAGTSEVREPDLVVPHPRLAARAFVLTPLAEIRPELKIPGGRATVQQLRDQLPPTVGEVTLIQQDW